MPLRLRWCRRCAKDRLPRSTASSARARVTLGEREKQEQKRGSGPLRVPAGCPVGPTQTSCLRQATRPRASPAGAWRRPTSSSRRRTARRVMPLSPTTSSRSTELWRLRKAARTSGKPDRTEILRDAPGGCGAQLGAAKSSVPMRSLPSRMACAKSTMASPSGVSATEWVSARPANGRCSVPSSRLMCWLIVDCRTPRRWAREGEAPSLRHGKEGLQQFGTDHLHARLYGLVITNRIICYRKHFDPKYLRHAYKAGRPSSTREAPPCRPPSPPFAASSIPIWSR